MTKKKERLFDLLIEALDEGIEDYKNGKPMRRYEGHKPDSPRKFSAAEIVEIRMKLMHSQALFAAYLGVSTKAVQAWEQGIREPNGSTRRLLELFSKNPEETKAAIAS